MILVSSEDRFEVSRQNFIESAVERKKRYGRLGENYKLTFEGESYGRLGENYKLTFEGESYGRLGEKTTYVERAVADLVRRHLVLRERLW